MKKSIYCNEKSPDRKNYLSGLYVRLFPSGPFGQPYLTPNVEGGLFLLFQAKAYAF